MVEKLSKFKDLEIEIMRIWGLKTETVPVVTMSTQANQKGLGKYIEGIPGNINIEDLQSISLLEPAYILKKVLSMMLTHFA